MNANTILKYDNNPLDIESIGEQDEIRRFVTAIEEKGKEELSAIMLFRRSDYFFKTAVSCTVR